VKYFISANFIIILNLILSPVLMAQQIEGFFGQSLGHKLAHPDASILIGAKNDPIVHYSVPVPSSFPVKALKYFVVKVDGETNIVGGISASVAVEKHQKCQRMKNTIEQLMNDEYKGIQKTEYGAWKAGKRSARVSCGGPRHMNKIILSIRVMDFEFNRLSEDKYIQKYMSLNE